MNKDQASLRIELIESFRELQETIVSSPFQVQTWFEKNINTASYAFLGHTGLTISEDEEGNHEWDVEIDNGTVYCKFNLSWYYKGEGESININKLATHFPHITVEQEDTNPYSGTLEFQMKLNLQEWPNLIPSILGIHLNIALVDDSYRDSDKRSALNAVKMLIAKHYPGITLEFLRIAISLGMVGNDSEVFVNWFTHHTSLSTSDNASAPLDFFINEYQ